MFSRTFMLLFLLYNVSNIEGKGYPPKGAMEYRFDYTYVEDVDGWMKTHLVPSTWSNAKLLCHAEGAVLASPTTVERLAAMVEHAKQSSVSTIFTGVHSTYAKGVYTSIEGELLTKMPIEWAPGEPDNFENSEDCLAMEVCGNGTMKDVQCNEVLPFICFNKRTSKHIKYNTTICGTHDSEYKFDERTEKCYKFHRHGLSWPRAYLTCAAEGGHLAVINSEVEFHVLRELFNEHPDNMIISQHKVFVSLGFSDPNDGGSWITIHGESLEEAGFERWQPGEPNNASQPIGELCGVMYRDTGLFNDAACHWSMPFICEKKQDSLGDD